MTRYIIKRLLLVIPIVLGVTVIVFCIINAIPGDPGRRMLGPMASQEQVDLLNEQLGYTLPFFQRLWDYLVDVVTFNFGTSYQDGTLVMHKIMLNFPYTLKLAVLQTLGYSVIGIGLGVFSAVKQYSIGDNIIRVISIALAAFPGFWVYMIAMLVFSLYLGWLPPSGVDELHNARGLRGDTLRFQPAAPDAHNDARNHTPGLCAHGAGKGLLERDGNLAPRLYERHAAHPQPDWHKLRLSAGRNRYSREHLRYARPGYRDYKRR